MVKCPHCSAVLPEGARICRSCGKIVEGGGIQYSVAEEPVSGPSAAAPAAPRRTTAGGVPRCEVCDSNPAMIQQVERNSPVVPGVMGFVVLLMLVMALAWHSWFAKLVLVGLAGGLGYAAYKILRAERRYWLCPKCGDTVDI
jgi:hypothetical protein